MLLTSVLQTGQTGSIVFDVNGTPQFTDVFRVNYGLNGTDLKYGAGIFDPGGYKRGVFGFARAIHVHFDTSKRGVFKDLALPCQEHFLFRLKRGQWGRTSSRVATTEEGWRKGEVDSYVIVPS